MTVMNKNVCCTIKQDIDDNLMTLMSNYKSMKSTTNYKT